MTWCRLEAGIVRHPKTLDLAVELGISRRETLGLLADLFAWTMLTRPSGLYDGIRPGAIETALDWTGEPGALVEALQRTGWLDVADSGALSLHGWQERAERWRRSAQEAARRRGPEDARKAPSKRKSADSKVKPGGTTVAPPWPHSGPTVSPTREDQRGESPPKSPPAQRLTDAPGGLPACVAQGAPLAVRELAPHPSPATAPIVERRPIGGALRAWSSDGRPLIACAGEPSEVLQWDYLCASIGPDALVGWLLSSDAERRLARVHPGSLHRAIEQGIARARPPTIADRLATDASLATDPRQQAALAGASALCAAVGRIEERRARQIAAELAAADVEGGALTADEVLGGIRAYASERAVLRRSARDGQIDPPEAFDVVHAVKRFARDERAKSAPVPKPEAPRAQPALQLLGPAPVEYEDGQDEAAALAIRRANGLERTEEDHARGLESVRSVLRSLGRAGA